MSKCIECGSDYEESKLNLSYMHIKTHYVCWCKGSQQRIPAVLASFYGKGKGDLDFVCLYFQNKDMAYVMKTKL